jgi:hypothetical protein
MVFMRRSEIPEIEVQFLGAPQKIKIMVQLITILILGYFIFLLYGKMKPYIQKLKQKILPKGNANLFDNYYVDLKIFYMKEFGRVPCVNYIDDINTGEVFDYINAGKAGAVIDIYQRTWFNWSQNRQEFTRTVFKLAGNTMIHLGDDYAEVYFDRTNYTYGKELIEIFATHKAPAKEEDYEINIITLSAGNLDLKQLAINKTELDIDLYYNDDFKAVDATIKERLAKENDKGIILLHGLPGTGKTTYLRHLIGSMKKKVLFVSPEIAGNLTNPEFMDLLLDNPNAVLVIEDAENIIMDRKYNPNSSVSNLLNISDGLLSDCLNVQMICTFNSALSYVDSALLRKGRLIAKYEFGKLEIAKAQKLSDHLGYKNIITQPLTLAEVTNPTETNYEAPKVTVLGFRREDVALN